MYRSENVYYNWAGAQPMVATTSAVDLRLDSPIPGENNRISIVYAGTCSWMGRFWTGSDGGRWRRRRRRRRRL